MILILFGIVFLSSETIKLENPVTIVTESAITIAGSSLTVTASAEQIPRTSTVTGLLLNNGSINIFLSISYCFTGLGVGTTDESALAVESATGRLSAGAALAAALKYSR